MSRYTWNALSTNPQVAMATINELVAMVLRRMPLRSISDTTFSRMGSDVGPISAHDLKRLAYV
jgi:hypothetical protein